MEFVTRTLYAVPMIGVALALGVFEVGGLLGFSFLTASAIVASGYEACYLYAKRISVVQTSESFSFPYVPLGIVNINTSVAPLYVATFGVSAFLYGAVFARSVLYLREYDMIMYLFLIVWTTDICALLFGKLSHFLTNSKPRLLRFISEHKTISGCLGGFCCGTSVGVLYYSLYLSKISGNDIDFNHILRLSALTSAASVCGDLLESAFKRACYTKDSDVIIKIPGHGGVLDRVDSILFAAPLCSAYVYCIRNENSQYTI